MNKILALIVISVLVTGVAFATQSYCDRYEIDGKIMEQGSYRLVVVDTIIHNDTMWCTEMNIIEYAGEYYSISFDIDAIAAGTIAGEILMRQGGERGNLPVYTSLFTLSAAIDSFVVITNLVDEVTWLQIGITNTDNSASIECDHLNLMKTQ